MSRPGRVLLLSFLFVFAGVTLSVDTGEAAGSEGHFLPPYVDVGRDTDGDGRLDQLVLDATVNATVGGAFGIDATLHDPTFALRVFVANASFLSTGLHTVSLVFYGPAIAEARVDGQLEADLRLQTAATFSS